MDDEKKQPDKVNETDEEYISHVSRRVEQLIAMMEQAANTNQSIH